MSRRALVVALAVLLPAPADADACLQPFAGERLELLCLTALAETRAMSLRELVRFDHLLAAQGYSERLGLVAEPANPALAAFAVPVLQYSSNINGGNPPGDLVLGDLVLRGDPALERRSGFLAGAAIAAAGRYRLGDGRHLDLSLGASYAHSPRHGIGIMTGSIGACLNSHVRNWWYLDVCGDARRTRRDLLDEREGAISASARRLFSSDAATHHEASVTVRRFFGASYAQDQVTAEWSVLHPDRLHWSLAVTLGEPVRDRLALRAGATASVGTLVAGRALQLWARHEIHDGGRILSVPRRDEKTTLGVRLGITDALSLSASYTWIDSSIPIFSDGEVFLSLQLSPWTF